MCKYTLTSRYLLPTVTYEVFRLIGYEGRCSKRSSCFMEKFKKGDTRLALIYLLNVNTPSHPPNYQRRFTPVPVFKEGYVWNALIRPCFAHLSIKTVLRQRINVAIFIQEIQCLPNSLFCFQMIGFSLNTRFLPVRWKTDKLP